MALYDDQKKKAKGLLSDGSPGLTPIPGSGLASAIGAVKDFRNNYQAVQTGAAQINRANGLHFSNPADPASMVARPSNRGLTAPVVPRPAVQPAIVTPPGASATNARASAGSAPSQRMTTDQANAAEVNARTATQTPAVPTQGAGASTSVGGAAPISKSIGKFGETVYSNVASPYGTPATAGTIGSVNTQNFGNAVVPQSPGAIARPGIASTFGLGVNDPRVDDQRAAIARPGQLSFNPAGNAESFNARESRDASQKLASDLDSQRFRLEMIASNPGRRGRAALEGLADNAKQRADIVGNTQALDAAAIQNRANRGNVLANTGMEQSGANLRQQMQGDVALSGQQVDREGNQLKYQTSMADIARPQLKQDANGNYINIAGNSSTSVLDANGKPVRGQQDAQAVARNYGQEADDKLLGDLLANKVDISGNPTPNALQEAMAELQQIRGQSAAPPPAAVAMLKKDPALAAQFDQKYGQGAAARYGK